MNKKGFTLVELIAVMVLIALISLLTFPNIRNLMRNNNEKEFTTYKDLMVEYAKTMPLQRYKDESGNGYICYADLNMKPINDSMVCNGYVNINGNTLTPYLYCVQNNKELYKDKGYSKPSDC